MKNIQKISIFLLIIALSISCKPQPDLSILVNGSFNVTPNIEKIRLGDTLRFTMSADANFPLASGGTYMFNDGKLSIPFDIGETDGSISASHRISNQSSFKVFANIGEFKLKNGSSMFGEISTSCINNKYEVDIFVMPQKRDTFYVWLDRGNLFNNKRSVPAQMDFLSNNQNLHLMLPSFTERQRKGMYAFIVE